MENWLKKRIALSPTKLAVVTPETKLTFRELGDLVSKQMGLLAKLVKKGTHVGVLTNNNLTGYSLILALQQLGCVIVLLNKRLAAPELQYQLADAEVELLIYEDDLALVDLTGLEMVSFSELANQTSEACQGQAEFKPDEVTTIMYTSGTSGQPKGVCQTYNNHLYSALGSALNLGLTTEDNWLCVVPLFHISGLSIMMRSLIYGMTVTLLPKFDADEVMRYLVAADITAISVVPTMLKQLLALGQSSLNPAFRFFLLGGGPIDKPSLEKCRAQGWPVIQSYGMTETASQVVALSFNDAASHLGSAGKPHFFIQLKLASDGEIMLKGPNISPGYYRQALKNQRTFVDGWFKTGDIGSLDQDGYLFVKGRKGEMIISGGENIFPREIEDCYLKLAAVAEIVVAAKEDAKWGQVPVAFIKLKEDISREKLVTYGRKFLAHYKVPKEFYLVTDYPRTASGKIQRYKLLAQLAKLQKIV